MLKILAFAGSSRKESFNKKLLKIAVLGVQEQGGYVMPIFNQDLIVKGTSTMITSSVTYSDATCSNMTSYFNTMFENVTVGSELTGLTAVSSPTKPTTAAKISSVEDKYALMANTTATIARFLSNYGTSVDSGIESVLDETSPVTKYGLAGTVTVSGTKYLYFHRDISTADNVTDWGSGSTLWQ